MSETIKYHDFIEVDYTGKLADGTVFDTTSAEIAQKHRLPAENREFRPASICVGEMQILPGLDAELPGKEVGKEYSVTLPPERAFGKRDVRKMKIIPMSTFFEHKMEPQPGLQIDVDGELGTVVRVSGGRIIVNFNHPLSGKEVTYTFTIKRKITQPEEQVSAYVQATLRIPSENMNVTISAGKAVVSTLPDLPPPLKDVLEKKLKELIRLHAVEFTVKSGEQRPR